MNIPYDTKEDQLQQYSQLVTKLNQTFDQISTSYKIFDELQQSQQQLNNALQNSKETLQQMTKQDVFLSNQKVNQKIQKISFPFNVIKK